MNLSKRIAFYTLGCKVNQYETESIKNSLLQLGHREVDFDEEADIYIVNTCTVTSIADRKSRNILRRAKKINKNSLVIVTGCYAQTNSEELEKIPEIDIILGNSEKKTIVDLVKEMDFSSLDENKNKKEKNGNFQEESFLSSKLMSKLIKVENIFSFKKYDEELAGNINEMTRAYVKIQDGCNNFCSYCKIPFARGRSRSREKNNIINEIRELVQNNYREIVLIGINLNAYGEDLKEKTTFEDLLEEIFEINGIDRIRIGSVYPDKITDRFISMFDNPKLMSHLHISLQSCDDTVLSMMKRNYNSRLIEERLLRLKDAVSNMEFTGDIIVGFPKESDKMFENTYNLIEKIGFSGLHIFPYSDRKNTEASKIPEKISNKIKKNRVKLMEELRDKMALNIRKKYIGKELSILVEEEKENCLYGHSENFLKVKATGNNQLVNKIINIKIISITKEMLLTDD